MAIIRFYNNGIACKTLLSTKAHIKTAPTLDFPDKSIWLLDHSHFVMLAVIHWNSLDYELALCNVPNGINVSHQAFFVAGKLDKVLFIS